MSRESEPVLTFEWNNDRVPKIVHQQREKYKQINRILDEQAVVLDLVHEDLKTLSRDSGSRRGRPWRGGSTQRPATRRPARPRLRPRRRIRRRPIHSRWSASTQTAIAYRYGMPIGRSLWVPWWKKYGWSMKIG